MTKLILFDNNFFRKLTKRPENDEQLKQWQKYFVGYINKQRPYECLITSFQFLEFIGVTNIKRPEIKDISFLTIPSNKDSNGKVVSEYDEVCDEITKYYSKSPCLSRKKLLSMKDEQLKKYTINSPHAKVLIEETIERFVSDENFEKRIYDSLTYDHIQHILFSHPNDMNVKQARYQLFKDLLGVISKGYNLSMVRLIRRIYLDERENNEKSDFILGSKDDYLDTEYLHYAVFGYWKEGFEAVTVLTCDLYERIKSKLKIVKSKTNSMINDIMKDALIRCNVNLGRLKPGNVVVCDGDSPRIINTINVDNLERKKMKVEPKYLIALVAVIIFAIYLTVSNPYREYGTSDYWQNATLESIQDIPDGAFQPGSCL